MCRADGKLLKRRNVYICSKNDEERKEKRAGQVIKSLKCDTNLQSDVSVVQSKNNIKLQTVCYKFTKMHNTNFSKYTIAELGYW